MKAESKKQKILTQSSMVLTFLVPLVLVLLVLKKCGIYFETNDDRILTEIMSGNLALKPDGHTVYISPVLAAPISWLYGITLNIPWHGCLLIGLHILLYVSLLRGLLADSRQRIGGAIAFVVMGCLFLVNIGMLGQIQYTSTAALVAGYGYAVLLLREEDEKGALVWFVIMELLACLLRDQSMLMIQPIGMTVYGAWILVKPELKLPRKIRKMALAVCAVVGVLLIHYLGDAVAYHSADWKDYLRANKALEQIFDYGEKPSAEEIADILEKYDVTFAEYNGYINSTVMEGVLPTECLEEIAAYCAVSRGKMFSFGSFLKDQSEGYLYQDFRGVNKVALTLWAILFLSCLVGRQWRPLVPAAGLMVARIGVWMILQYGGRMPQRVSYPLFACEILMLTVLIWKSAASQTKLQIGMAVLMLLWFGVEAFSCGRTQYRYVSEINRGQEAFFEGMAELQDYCARNPERQYYVEAVSLSYYSGSALETESYKERDFMVTGYWYSASPTMNAKLKQFQQEREEGIYLIIYESGNQLTHPAVEFFAERTASEPVQADQFTLSHGGSYVVYYFEE